jgi:hypothetical protein
MGSVEKGGGQAVQSPYCRIARRIVHAGRIAMAVNVQDAQLRER